MKSKKEYFTVEVSPEGTPELKITLQFSKLESAREYVKKQHGAILLERKAA